MRCVKNLKRTGLPNLPSLTFLPLLLYGRVYTTGQDVEDRKPHMVMWEKKAAATLENSLRDKNGEKLLKGTSFFWS